MTTIEECSSDTETDELSVPFKVNIQEQNGASEYIRNGKLTGVHSGKRKLKSDSISSSDSGESDSLCISVQKFDTLSVTEKRNPPLETDNICLDAQTYVYERTDKNSDKDGDTYLHISVIFKKKDSVLNFLCSISDAELREMIDKKNKLKQTALHLAAHVRDSDIIECLLFAGADPGLQDADGRTFIHILTENGDDVTLRNINAGFELNGCTVEYSGSDCQLIDVPNYDGLTALHLATKRNHGEMVFLLISLGATINIKDRRSGRTALHFAAEAGNMNIVQTIVGHSRRYIDAQTFNGETALILSYHRGHDSIVELLKDNGAEHDKLTIANYGPVRRKVQKRKEIEKL